MRMQEMRQLTAEEIREKVRQTRRELTELRFQQRARKIDSPAKIRQARRLLARLLTVAAQQSKGEGPVEAGASELEA